MILHLKEWMKKRNMTSVELAERVGVTKTMVSYWLTGRNFPSLDNIEVISSVLDVPVWQLLGLDIPEDIPPRKMIAFFHYQDKSYTPTSVGEVMEILKTWHFEEFHRQCHQYDFEHIREKYAGNKEIQELMDSLSALLDYPDDNQNNIQQ